MDTSFRKIDIDQYDEDVLQDSELYEADPRGPAEVLEDAKQRQVAVRSLLARYVVFFLHLPKERSFGIILMGFVLTNYPFVSLEMISQGL